MIIYIHINIYIHIYIYILACIGKHWKLVYIPKFNQITKIRETLMYFKVGA